METTQKEKLLKIIESHIEHHRKWRRITSFSYCTTSVLTLLASFSATISAAMDQSQFAAVFAGVAAAAAGIEKALLFGEKWRTHLAIQTEFQNMKLDAELSTKDLNHIIDGIKETSSKYALKLPSERN